MSAGVVVNSCGPSFQLGLLAVLLLVTATADLAHPLGLGLLALLALLNLALTPGALRVLARRLGPLLLASAVALGLALVAPTPPGTATVLLPGLSRPVSAASLHFVIALLVKALLIVAWVTACAQRLSERDLLEGLTGLRLPPRLTTLCYLLVRSLRSVGAEVRRLTQACAARGRPRGLRAVTVAGAVATVLLVRLARRADWQAFALLARGFTGQLPLLTVRPLRPALALLLLATGGGLLWLSHC